LNQIGVGAIMSPAWRYRMRMPSPAGAQSATAQIVVLHAMQAPNGQVSDVELLAFSDASLNEAALAHIANWQGGIMGQEPETGATPQSHEIVMILQYVSQPAVTLTPQ
jgi:hypothetical protein